MEVHYARNTSLSMSDSEKFFKLRRNGKTLESLEYAQCLTQYLDNSRSLTKLTIPDLKNVLGSIQTVMFGQVLPLTSTTQSFCAGEHVIVAWSDRSYTWELGVVEKCHSANIVVSHMLPTNQENTC